MIGGVFVVGKETAIVGNGLFRFSICCNVAIRGGEVVF